MRTIVDDEEESEEASVESGMFRADASATDIDVLAVDDDIDQLDLTATYLEREREAFDVTTETDPTAVVDRLAEGSFDAVVSDYDMPLMNGLDVLDAIREEYPDLPFVLFTGKGSEEIASEAISKGVTDYLQKQTSPDQYSLLANRVRNAVEQYHASRALKRSEETFSKVVRNSSDVIGIVDTSGRFTYISPACEHTLGYEQAELVGESAFEYMPPSDRQTAMDEFFTAVENPDYKPVIEFQFEDPEGGWTHVEARGTNLFDDEVVNGFVVNARDVTEQKKREQALRQQNERLRDMRKVVSHDLKNPIGVTADALEMYRETGEGKWLDKIDNAAERMDALIDQVVALSADETTVSDLEQTSFKQVVKLAWETVPTENATLYVEDSKELEADPARLRQALENLIRNAVEHSRGEVDVRVGTTDEGIYFEDDGPGIDEEDRERVFESGYTTRTGNTGFGLSIVNQIVIGHGWEIAVSESDRGGARFEVTGITFQPTVYS
ncbi:hybrid sensor histidine kinase/response regulator [Halosegnis marinus]|uniref:histidine kinase n=1 Tax=Halosegnis marinus TaxID=3034023 RepID=A0ABD5ZPI1_9EURY|nr:ATP-binding protein [Halosegnis sp. DT85]